MILGASGYLGSRFLSEIGNSFGTYFQKNIDTNLKLFYLNGFKENDLEILLNKVKPDVVLNCIGFPEVDLCEILPEKSYLINTWLPYKFAAICKELSIKYVHFSTDHYESVSGKKLRELEQFKIINQYGAAKNLAERMILKANNESLIVRANFFHFGSNTSRNFLENLIVKITSQKLGESFHDVYFTPIATTYLIRYVQMLIEMNYVGLIHISSNEVVSKYDFHEMVLQKLELDTKFHKSVSVEKIQLAARRPKFMALDNSLMNQICRIKVPTLYDMISEEITKYSLSKEN